jgi:hypothetical protein
MPRPESHESHSWEDESYHGSPLYYCEYCRIFEGDSVKAKLPCPNRDSILKSRQVAKELAERTEYQALLRQRQRFEELHKKYGNTPP